MIDIEKIMRQRHKAIVDDVRDGVREVASEVLEVARVRAPKLTGELRRSGKVTDTAQGSELAFTAEHATTVHEDPLSSGHKFLETAIKERSGDFAATVAKGVDLG